MADDPATLAAKLLAFIKAADQKAAGSGFQTQVRSGPSRAPRPSPLLLVVEDCLDRLTPDECDALGRMIEQLTDAL